MTRQSINERARRREANNKAKNKKTKAKQAVKEAVSVPVGKQIAARQAAIENMNPKLLAKFNKIEQGINDIRVDNIHYYYNLGKLVHVIESAPDEYRGKDGADGVELIVDALSTQRRMLTDCLRVCKEITEEQLEELINLSHAETKFALHWGHIRYLLIPKTWARRRHWAAEAVQHMLDPKAMYELIQKSGENRAANPHGRTHTVPTSVAAQVRQLLAVSKNWVGKQEQVWAGDNNVFSNVVNAPVENLPPDIVNNLTEAIEVMEKISEGANSNVAAARRAVEIVNDKLAKAQARVVNDNRTGGRPARNVTIE